MKRNAKNCLMIGIIILLVIGSYLTMNSLKSNSIDSIPSMNDFKPFDNNNENHGDRKFNNNIKERKGKDNGNSKMLPKNRGDEVTGNSNNEMPTPPDMNSNMPPENNDFGNKREMFNMEIGSKKLETYHYIIFGVNSLIISCILIYLIMSKMNKMTFKEVFQDSDKVIITVLSCLILTVGFTYLDIYLTNNYFVNSTNNIKMDNGNKGGKDSNITYSASKEITSNETITSGTFNSSNKDENAISISGDIEVNLSNINVSKTGDSDGGDSTSFYGTNSSVIAKDKANVTISDATIVTNANGANGVFSYGGSATTNNSSNDGTKITISNSKITTTGNNSGGIMTTGGGIMNANNLSITTSGISSAAIRSDRGGGKVTVNSGTYETNGQGSPAIYSTADITVANAKLISNTSEGIIIEGANSVNLDNCELIDSNTKLNGQSTTYKNIFLYQSMSGDAKSGEAIFTSKNSSITTNNGDSFYVTNTRATINLENNTIINNDNTGNFLRIKADSWGNSGSNGGNVTMNLTKQNVVGNIMVDDISTLSLNINDNSSFEGMINNDNKAKEINLVIDSTSKITLTGDSYITSLSNSDKDNNNINFNGYKLYVNGKSIN